MLGELNKAKFRHVYLHPYQKEESFEGIRITNSRVDGSLMSCNREYITVVLQTSGGGVFTVLKVNEPKRYDVVPKFVGHTGPITDIQISSLQIDRVCSADELGCFNFWQIQDPFPDETNTVIGSIQLSSRRGVQSVWHLCIEDCVFLMTQDRLVLAECTSSSILKDFKLPDNLDVLQYVAFCEDYSKMVICTKDKQMHVINTVDDSIIHQFQPHDGNKPARCAFHSCLGDKYLITTGSTKNSERYLSLWDLDDVSQPKETIELDRGFTVFTIHCDSVGLILLASKGDVSVRVFEIIKDPLKMLDLGFKQLKEPGAQFCFGNKLCCNYNMHEIIRGFKCTAKHLLEPVSLLAAKKATTFQADLYPDCPGEEANMTTEEFLSGKRCKPKLTSIKAIAGSSFKNDSFGSISRSQTTTLTRAVVTKSLSSMNQHKNVDVYEELDTLKKTVLKLTQDLEELKSKVNAQQTTQE